MVERMASSGIAGRRVIIIKDRSNSLHSYNTWCVDYSIHSYIHTYLQPGEYPCRSLDQHHADQTDHQVVRQTY